MDFSDNLIKWYKDTNRELPWRKSQNPYFVWLSEIILQQTKVSQGLPYYLKFTESYPTVQDLAEAEEEEVLKLWQGLGYYSRARNLHHTAKHIVTELNGVFPKTYKELIKLKGIGDYTASAIASICYNEPNAVVDGNVYRVLSRFYGVETAINSTQGIKEFKELAQTLMDKEQAGTYNQAIMDFGALHCKPKQPLCAECCFTDKCIALSENKIDSLPLKIKKIKVKKRYFNFLYVLVNGRTIVEKRMGKGIWQNLYQLPLIETKKSINEIELINSSSFQDLFPQGASIKLFNQKEKTHKLSHQHLITKFWLVETQEVNALTINIQDLRKYPVPVLISDFLEKIEGSVK